MLTLVGAPAPIASPWAVIDFGGATYEDDDSKSTIVNTRQYRAPEVSEMQWPDRQAAGSVIPWHSSSFPIRRL